ncbi:superoxide dismutase [Oscillospiraceae bacterium LTW-04]|nr:superoxide dismutase [Oscillospiraceae bacterium MB24-C1]
MNNINNSYKFVNLPLPYAYNSMEPFIDAKTMEIHHDRHLQGYVNNLNKALERYPELQRLPLEALVTPPETLPASNSNAIRNNAGGVYNHRFYFNGLIPAANAKSLSGMLLEDINKTYGSFDAFKSAFKNAALSVFGSGYAWLVVDNRGDLKIITTANQDTPLSWNLCPILNIDVWEHAYYLKHYNMRASYIDDWFNVVDWDNANINFSACFNTF